MTLPLDHPSLRDELKQLEDELAALNERRVEIYTRSLEAAQDEKGCADIAANAMLQGPLHPGNKIAWPVQVNGIGWNPENPPVLRRAEAHGWVAVRPLLDDGARTYLGIHIGDVAMAVQAQLGPEDRMLHMTHTRHSPCIYIPALGVTVMGAESWWNALKDPDDLDEITDADPEDIWYARAAQDLATTEDPGDQPH